MRRMTTINASNAECLRRALEYDWLTKHCETNAGAAFFFDRARLWRSLALVAYPELETESWHKLGFTAARQDNGDYKLAIYAYTEAIALTPMNADLYCKRGAAYLALGNRQLQAYQDLRTSRIDKRPIDLNDSLWVPYANAITDFSKAIELAPHSADGYNRRGTVHAAIGDQTRAVSDYCKAIDIDPDYLEAYRNRSASYARLGEREKSAADVERARSLGAVPSLPPTIGLPQSVTE